MVKDYFSFRTTVRSFSEKQIPDSLLNDIIERAAHAPTCGNMQLYSVVITRDKENKHLIEAQHYNQPASTESNVILTICADFNRFSRWCTISGAEPCYDNFHSFMMALTDAVILAQQIVTIAEMEGLGTCYLGTVNYNAEKISEILRLPEKVIPVASVALGYPKGEGKMVERLPAEAFLHVEHYRNDPDEKILDYFKVKEDFPDNQQYIKENNKPSLASVFTDIRYPKDVNESVSESFMRLLREKNFINDKQ